jgi:hypothetical protein
MTWKKRAMATRVKLDVIWKESTKKSVLNFRKKQEA